MMESQNHPQALADLETLRAFASGTPETFLALKRRVETYMAELVDIRNVDLAKNVGLQTSARRYAFDSLCGFFKEMGLWEKVKEGGRKTESFH